MEDVVGVGRHVQVVTGIHVLARQSELAHHVPEPDEADVQVLQLAGDFIGERQR